MDSSDGSETVDGPDVFVESHLVFEELHSYLTGCRPKLDWDKEMKMLKQFRLKMSKILTVELIESVPFERLVLQLKRTITPLKISVKFMKNKEENQRNHYIKWTQAMLWFKNELVALKEELKSTIPRSGKVQRRSNKENASVLKPSNERPHLRPASHPRSGEKDDGEKTEPPKNNSGDQKELDKVIKFDSKAQKGDKKKEAEKHHLPEEKGAHEKGDKKKEIQKHHLQEGKGDDEIGKTNAEEEEDIWLLNEKTGTFERIQISEGVVVEQAGQKTSFKPSSESIIIFEQPDRKKSSEPSKENVSSQPRVTVHSKEKEGNKKKGKPDIRSLEEKAAQIIEKMTHEMKEGEAWILNEETGALEKIDQVILLEQTPENRRKRKMTDDSSISPAKRSKKKKVEFSEKVEVIPEARNGSPPTEGLGSPLVLKPSRLDKVVDALKSRNEHPLLAAPVGSVCTSGPEVKAEAFTDSQPSPEIIAEISAEWELKVPSSDDPDEKLCVEIEELLEKLRKLESTEVDFSEEDKSAYVESSKLKAQVVAKFKKLTELTGQDFLEQGKRFIYQGKLPRDLKKDVEEAVNSSGASLDIKTVMLMIMRHNWSIVTGLPTEYDAVLDLAKTIASNVNRDVNRARLAEQFEHLNASASSWLGSDQWSGMDPAATDGDLRAKLEENDRVRLARQNEIVVRRKPRKQTVEKRTIGTQTYGMCVICESVLLLRPSTKETQAEVSEPLCSGGDSHQELVDRVQSLHQDEIMFYVHANKDESCSRYQEFLHRFAVVDLGDLAREIMKLGKSQFGGIQKVEKKEGEDLGDSQGVGVWRAEKVGENGSGFRLKFRRDS